MIAALRGRVLASEDDQVVVDAAGVGYQVFCHLRTLASLHEVRDGEVTLHIHTSVSADAIRLYGFVTREELRLFRLLIVVERIGPKAALGILGRAELPTLVRAIRTGEVGLLATVPGVGRKTAERVILELRDKLDGFGFPGDAGVAPAVAGSQAVAAAVEGLVGLGFREGAARVAVAEVVAESDGEPDVGALVSAALSRLDTVGAGR